MTDDLMEILIESARAAADRAYAPYSNFKVGAAVMSDSGKIYVGCNVENASYGACLCAERSAIAQMVAAGDHRLVTVAIFTNTPEPSMPCGICRQVIREFGPDAEIVASSPGKTKHTSIEALLPDPFHLKK